MVAIHSGWKICQKVSFYNIASVVSLKLYFVYITERVLVKVSCWMKILANKNKQKWRENSNVWNLFEFWRQNFSLQFWVFFIKNFKWDIFGSFSPKSIVRGILIRFPYVFFSKLDVSHETDTLGMGNPIATHAHLLPA